jgi:hypothetical protein
VPFSAGSHVAVTANSHSILRSHDAPKLRVVHLETLSGPAFFTDQERLASCIRPRRHPPGGASHDAHAHRLRRRHAQRTRHNRPSAVNLSGLPVVL